MATQPPFPPRDKVVPVADRTILGLRSSLIGKLPLILAFGLLAALGAWGTRHLIDGWNSIQLSGNLLHLAASLSNALLAAMVVAVTGFRLAPTHRAAGMQPWISAILGTFLSLGLILIPPAALPVPLIVLGLMMMICGCLTAFYVLTWLGRSFSIMAEARRLVMSGPYGIVRHPLYVCEEVAVLGALILHFSPIAVVMIAAQCAFQFRRMRNEETVLRRAFPEYEAYAAAVPLVIPRRRRRAAMLVETPSAR